MIRGRIPHGVRLWFLIMKAVGSYEEWEQEYGSNGKKNTALQETTPGEEAWIETKLSIS